MTETVTCIDSFHPLSNLWRWPQYTHGETEAQSEEGTFPKPYVVATLEMSRSVSKMCSQQEKGGETPGKRRINLCKQ